MDTLCFATDMTSSEWAAWVQAIGTIFAVFGAGWLAWWQAMRQHQSALDIHRAEQRQARLNIARTLLVLAQNCTKATKHFASQMHDRESVFLIATRETYFDFGELKAIQSATTDIPLHSLPDSMVTHAMVLGATVRQFRQTIDMAVELHRKMDAAQFGELLKTLGEMTHSLELTCKDIDVAVKAIKRDA